MATIAAWGSSDIGDHRAAVENERRGVAYLRPLTRLLGSLVAGQSAAVRGEQVEIGQLQSDLAEVERVEARHGAVLKTRSRWPTLRFSVNELIQRPGSPGLLAYQRWGQAVDLTVALGRRIGDTSTLMLDDAIDTSSLIDAGLARLPETMQLAGQLADLGQMTPGLRAEDARAAVLRDRIATNSAQVANSLSNVVDATSSGRVGSALLSPLDQFGAATDALAPSLAVASMPPLPANLAAAAVGVRDSAQRLSQTIWAELDRLFVTRLDDLSAERVQLVAVAVLGLLVAVAVGVALLMGRPPARPRRRSPAHAAPEDPVGPGAGPSVRAEPPGYPGPNTDPAVSAITGTSRAQAGVR